MESQRIADSARVIDGPKRTTTSRPNAATGYPPIPRPPLSVTTPAEADKRGLVQASIPSKGNFSIVFMVHTSQSSIDSEILWQTNRGIDNTFWSIHTRGGGMESHRPTQQFYRERERRIELLHIPRFPSRLEDPCRSTTTMMMMVVVVGAGGGGRSNPYMLFAVSIPKSATCVFVYGCRTFCRSFRSRLCG